MLGMLGYGLGLLSGALISLYLYLYYAGSVTALNAPERERERVCLYVPEY